MTNSEWFKNLINNASDEELAKFYVTFCECCVYNDIPKCYQTHDCFTGHLEWLQADHKE